MWFSGKAKATSEVAEDFPFGSSNPNILFDNSIAALLADRRSSVTPIFDPLVINNNKIRLFSSFTCVFSFYSSNPHSFRFSLTILIYSSSSRHSFETSHLPCVVLVFD